MKYLKKVYLPYEILEETTKSLRVYGDQFYEGLVLWLGVIDKDNNTCRVTKIITPEQNSIKSENGVGYFVNTKTLLGVNKLLSETGLRLLAQIHSHPGRAYHSNTDDRYCIVTEEGGFSIVVPDFGFGPSDLLLWATYKLTDGYWKKLSKSNVKSTFMIEGKFEEAGSESETILTSIRKMFGH